MRPCFHQEEDLPNSEKLLKRFVSTGINAAVHLFLTPITMSFVQATKDGKTLVVGHETGFAVYTVDTDSGNVKRISLDREVAPPDGMVRSIIFPFSIVHAWKKCTLNTLLIVVRQVIDNMDGTDDRQRNRSSLTPLEPQSRFGDKLLEI